MYNKSNNILKDASGDGNHFIENYRSGRTWQAPRYHLVEDALVKLNIFLQDKHGSVQNATNGGRLEVLDRTCVSNLLQDN